MNTKEHWQGHGNNDLEQSGKGLLLLQKQNVLQI
jgi:hypothetical protein